jgi:hypothetical protein
MPICIFCPEPLTSHTKPEHILLTALGGRKSTTRIDCSTCNSLFGSTIDKAVTEQVAVLRNMLGLESGVGKPPPALRRVKAGSDQINMNSDGTLDLVQKPFALTKREDGSTILNISTGSIEDLAAHIPNIAAMLKCSEEQVVALLGTGSGRIVSRRPDTIHFSMAFGGEDAVRSFTKSCLVLWATLTGNAEVKSSMFEAARNFVMNGSSLFSRDRVHLDSRYLPHFNELKRRFGDFFNLIYIRSDSVGRVIGHFTLYNVMSWHIVLAEEGATPNLKIGLVSNPTNPLDWSDSIADEIDIDFAWMNSPDYSDEFVRARERLSAAFERSQKDALSRELDSITRTSFEKHGVEEGAAVTDPATIKAIIGEISHRTALHMLNLPHEEAIQGVDIAAKLEAVRKKSCRG